jgi:hypothetical protein
MATRPTLCTMLQRIPADFGAARHMPARPLPAQVPQSRQWEAPHTCAYWAAAHRGRHGGPPLDHRSHGRGGAGWRGTWARWEGWRGPRVSYGRGGACRKRTVPCSRWQQPAAGGWISRRSFRDDRAGCRPHGSSSQTYVYERLLLLEGPTGAVLLLAIGMPPPCVHWAPR